MRKYFAAVAVAGVVGAAIACGSSGSPTSPSSTTAPVSTAALESLKVTGPPLVVGDSKQFTATAFFKDGTSQNVTGQSVWSSSNAAIAAVDQTGKVTAVKEGGVSIRASYRGATDTEYHNVTPLLFFKAAGTVSEVPPGFNAIPGARVEIIAGSSLGSVAMADGSGAFSFGTMRGDNYTFKVTRDGFQKMTKTVTLTRDMGNIEMLMYPVPPSGATARCKDKSWSFSTDRPSACSRNGGVAYFVCPGMFCGA